MFAYFYNTNESQAWILQNKTVYTLICNQIFKEVCLGYWENDKKESLHKRRFNWNEVRNVHTVIYFSHWVGRASAISSTSIVIYQFPFSINISIFLLRISGCQFLFYLFLTSSLIRTYLDLVHTSTLKLYYLILEVTLSMFLDLFFREFKVVCILVYEIPQKLTL